MLAKQRGWQVNRRDQLAGLQRRIHFWSVSGQAVKLCNRNRALATQTAHAHHGIERRECDAHIRRVHGDTLRTGAENRVRAVLPFYRSAAAAWLALVALGKG